MKLKTDLQFGSKNHEKILEYVLGFARESDNKMVNKREQWKKNLPQYHAYLDLAATDRIRQTQARPDATYPGSAPIKIPLTKTLGEIYITYLMEVYTSVRPLFRYVGEGSEDMIPAEMLETVIEYQTTSPYIRDKMLLYHLFQDLVIYNMACIRVSWLSKTSTAIQMQKYIQLMGQRMPVSGNIHPMLQKFVVQDRVQREITSYEGNKVSLIDPFEILPDTRFPLSRMQDGEFFGNLFSLPWSEIEELAAEEVYFNTEYVEDLGLQGMFNRITDSASSLRATIHSTNQINPNTSSTGIVGTGGSVNNNWRNGVQILDMEIRMIPEKMGLKWDEYDSSWHKRVQTILFTVINGQVICRCEPCTTMNKKFSYVVCELKSDGHTFGHRGISEDLAGYQEELSWYHNFRVENSRQVNNGSGIADPSVLEMGDFANTVPGGYVRKKPAFYGIDVANIGWLPMNTPDMTNNLITDSQIVYEMAKLLMGINDTMTGAVSSGRHSATETGAAMQAAAGRLKCIAEVIDTYFFEPFSDLLKQNTQQNLSPEFYNKIIGRKAGGVNQQLVSRNIEEIMGDFNYMRRDGLIPMNKLQEAAIFQTWYRDTVSNPILLKIFNIVKIFSKGLEKVGIKNPEDFVIDSKYYENLMGTISNADLEKQVKAGNAVPIPDNGNGRGIFGGNNPNFEPAGAQGFEGSQGASYGQ